MDEPIPLHNEEKLLLVRRLQHGEEGIQPITGEPQALFLHLHTGYHITHRICVVLTSLPE